MKMEDEVKRITRDGTLAFQRTESPIDHAKIMADCAYEIAALAASKMDEVLSRVESLEKRCKKLEKSAKKTS